MPVLDAEYEEKKTYWHLHASLVVEHEVCYVNDVLCFRKENMSLTLSFEMLDVYMYIYYEMNGIWYHDSSNQTLFHSVLWLLWCLYSCGMQRDKMFLSAMFVKNRHFVSCCLKERCTVLYHDWQIIFSLSHKIQIHDCVDPKMCSKRINYKYA